MKTPATVRSAFTLIELLIVVAIIAILAAIAVPNFLEAQTRAKVSRLVSDYRTFKVGLESYRVDNNKYPETDTGKTDQNGLRGKGMYRLTSPVAYLTSISKSPFNENKIGNGGAGQEQWAVLNVHPLYVRSTGTDGITSSALYPGDRGTYLLALNISSGGQCPPLLALQCTEGEYMIKSVGPDNTDDRDTQQVGSNSPARVYDPSNGTISNGDVVTFADTSINAANK